MSTIKRYRVDTRITEEGMVPYLKADPGGVLVLYDDHLAALRAAITPTVTNDSQATYAATVPINNTGEFYEPVIEVGDVLVQDGATQRTKIYVIEASGDRPPASDRPRLTWYVDYRAGETEYRVVEELPER